MASTDILLSSRLLFIQQQLTRYVYSTILVFGIIGSCLNIVLLSRKQFRTSSCCIYLLVMSAAILVLLSWVIGLYLYALDHVDPVTSIPVLCKMRIYVLQSSALTYRWCLTVACLDRYALTAISVRMRNFARIPIARRAVVIIIIAWIVLPMHSLIFYNLRDNICGILYSTAASLYHSIFTTVVAAIVPTTIMCTCALLIYRNLIRKQQRRERIASRKSNETNKSQNRRDQQVLLMLLIQAAVYVGTTIPLMGMYFYNALTIYVTNKSADRIAIERFSFYLAELINFLFSASSFYLYTMASHMFRHELINMLRSTFHYPSVGNTTRVIPMTNDIPIQSLSGYIQKMKSLPTSATVNQNKTENTLDDIQQQTDPNSNEI